MMIKSSLFNQLADKFKVPTIHKFYNKLKDVKQIANKILSTPPFVPQHTSSIVSLSTKTLNLPVLSLPKLINIKSPIKIITPTFKQPLKSFITKATVSKSIIQTNVFGVPPDFLVPSTLAGKQYISDINELFRFFIIHDVGVFRLQDITRGSIWSFKFESCWKSSTHGISFNQVLSAIIGQNVSISPPIKFALQNNEFTLGFTNSYGDSFLEQFNNIISNAARQSVYFTGQTLTESTQQFWNLLKQIPILGQMLGAGGFLASHAADTANLQQRLSQFLQQHPALQQMLNALNRGNKVVLPKVWQVSSFTNSYQLRTTLYSLTDDPDEIMQRVLYPLAILLAISTPKAVNAYFYEYPFVIRCEIEGVRQFPAAVITDLRITLGGEQSFYDVDKRYLALNVDFAIADVYDVMVTAIESENLVVPTTGKWFQYVKKYLLP